MARVWTAGGKDHAPGEGGHLAPELAVDEIAHAPEKESWRDQGCDEVRDVEKALLPCLCKVEEGCGKAQGSAVEGHATVPETEDLGRFIKVERKIVEEDIANAGSEDEAQHADGHKIVHVPGLPAVSGSADAAYKPAEQKARHVHEPVPADSEAADGKGNGIKGCVHVLSARTCEGLRLLLPVFWVALGTTVEPLAARAPCMP